MEKGASVKAAENDGCTVMVWACYGGHEDVGKYIIFQIAFFFKKKTSYLHQNISIGRDES